VVVDNGSTDGSDQIAKQLGVEVRYATSRGYGATVHFGIESSTSPWVVYFDGDGTYRIEDAYRVAFAAMEQSADLAIGSRFLGTIQKGAMPWHHRAIGTPVLSRILSFLSGRRVSDCNSGLRCVRAKSYRAWGLTSSGMEYATEMLLRAAWAKSKVIEVPIVLRAAPPERVSHLCWWRDGLRHLRVLFGTART
jgi:glycosyltransferase involved in cell wall biosynthesis